MKIAQGLLIALMLWCNAAGAGEATVWHSGGTDSNGCHYNHKTGVYHCH